MCSYHCFTISLCELNCIVNICVPIDIHVCGYVLVYVFFLFEEGGWWRERYTLGVGIISSKREGILVTSSFLPPL